MPALRIIRRLRDLLDVNPGGLADGDVPTWDAANSEFIMEQGGGGGGPPSGPAGGVLGGTYPDPAFAADMATQAELDAVAAAKTDLTTFNDHSARHEDGGADEISIAGLSGTPAALTTHESDTTNVHGITDTSALALTANVPSNATFNDHSARHENGGADEISVAGLSGELADAQPITVRKNTGADVGTRSRLNLIEGTNVTLTLADDAGSDEVDITVAASGGTSFWDDIIVKQADESVASSTSFQNDDELLFPILANTDYYFEMLVMITSTSSAADFKCDFVLSAGSTLNAWKQHMGLGPTTQVAQAGQHADLTTAIIWATGTALTNVPANKIIGMVRGDTNANLQFRWAQNTSDLANVTVKAGSVMTYRALVT